MNITKIEELQQRIGKFVIFSQNDPNCNDKYATMKLLTKIEKRWLLVDQKYKKPNSEFFGYNIWGKFSASPKKPFVRYSNGEETWSNVYLYARDPTEQEIKQFKQMWREYLFIKRKMRSLF